MAKMSKKAMMEYIKEQCGCSYDYGEPVFHQYKRLADFAYIVWYTEQGQDLLDVYLVVCKEWKEDSAAKDALNWQITNTNQLTAIEVVLAQKKAEIKADAEMADLDWKF